MAKIVGSAPILLVADVVAAAEYYRDRLGFEYERFIRPSGTSPKFVQIVEWTDGIVELVAAGFGVTFLLFVWHLGCQPQFWIPLIKN